MPPVSRRAPPWPVPRNSCATPLRGSRRLAHHASVRLGTPCKSLCDEKNNERVTEFDSVPCHSKGQYGQFSPPPRSGAPQGAACPDAHGTGSPGRDSKHLPISGRAARSVANVAACCLGQRLWSQRPQVAATSTLAPPSGCSDFPRSIQARVQVPHRSPSGNLDSGCLAARLLTRPFSSLVPACFLAVDSPWTRTAPLRR